jgi:NADH:ubiquinone oxidoreductase subunit C
MSNFNIEKFFIINAQNFIKNFHQADNNLFEVEVVGERVFEFFYFLKHHENLSFNQLTDMVAYDRLSYKLRFNLIYSFFSFSNNFRIHALLQMEEGSPVYSIIDLFEGAS